jgi:RNA exonuclease 4
MVGVGPDGMEDSLARVSIVNYFGHVLYDAFIKPTQRVTDFRTKFSGIRPADILNPTGISSFLFRLLM